MGRLPTCLAIRAKQRTPVLLGQGESLFDGLDLQALGFSITERKTSEYATHLVLEKG